MTPIKECEFRIAGEDDLYPIIAVGREGTEETNYGLKFNMDHAVGYVWAYICDNELDIIVAILDNEVVGFAMIAVSFEFYEQPHAFLAKFWVSKAGRRSNASRGMMGSAVAWAKKAKASHLFVTATGGLNGTEQQLFINLMKKSGFLDGGPVMSLKIESHPT